MADKSKLKEYMGMCKDQYVVLNIFYDDAINMAKISMSISGDTFVIMEGNYWDFHSSCHGGWHYELEKEFGSFINARSMCHVLSKALEAGGAKGVVVKTNEYKYE